MVELATNVVALSGSALAIALTTAVLLWLQDWRRERGRRRAEWDAAQARTVQIQQRIDVNRQRMDADFDRDMAWVTDRIKRSATR